MGAGKIITIVVALVVALICFPIISGAVDDIGTPPVSENFTAVNNASVVEPCTLTYTPIASSVAVAVNSVDLVAGDWTTVGKIVTLDAATSTTGDDIAIDYTYTKTLGTGMATILPLIPVLFLLFILGIVALGLKKLF